MTKLYFWVRITDRNEIGETFTYLDRIEAKNKYQAEEKALSMYRSASEAKAV